jgi:hypothetical protein
MSAMKVILLLLISFVAFTATISGFMMIISPDDGMMGLPLSLLQETPFRSFLLPGIILLLAVGGINIGALASHLQRSSYRYGWAIAGGIVTLGWIVVQMLLIGTVSWLHYLYLTIGLLIVLIAWQLKGKWAL